MLAKLTRFFLYPRHLLRPDPLAGEGLARLEKHRFAVDGGDVEWWMWRADVVGRAPTVIFAHGNGELIEQWPPMLRGYHALGVHVVLPEYRGYGRSAGKPSERAIREDMLRVHDAVAAREDVDPTRILLHGRSLGGGVVCLLAKERKPRAMLLSSTFTSVPDVARRFLVPRPLVTEVFDNLSVVRRLRDVPLHIVHGTADTLIPFSHAETLARAHGDATLQAVPGAGHNDCPHWDRFFDDVTPFLRDAGIAR